jgi:hypothetical protein
VVSVRHPRWIHARLRESGVTLLGGYDLIGESINHPIARRLITLGQLTQRLADLSGVKPKILQTWHWKREPFKHGAALDLGASSPAELETLQLAACGLWRDDARLFGLGLLADRVRLEVWREGATARRYWGPRSSLMFASPMTT